MAPGLSLAPARPTIDGRDATPSVVLIGFIENENLGIGYLTSFLRAYDVRVHTIDFERPPEEILREVLAARPIIVGFSLIFQLYIDRFERVIRFLRDAGVEAHFTMGGHFASLSSERTLNLLPSRTRQ